MNELETELRDLFLTQVADAERPVNLLPGVRRRASRTTHWRIGAGALAGAVVIAAVVLPMVARPSASSPRAPISVHHEPPRGWVAVDYGIAQIWVPPSWPIESAGGCVGSHRPGVMYGNWPRKHCPLPFNVLQITNLEDNPDFVRWGFLPRRLAHARRLEVNGLAVEITPAGRHGQSVEVPGLNVRLAARGPVAIRALGTLRRSPLADAGPKARAVLPAGFRWFEFGGIKFAAPAAWPVRHGTVAVACSPDVELGYVVLSSRQPVGGLMCGPFATDRAGYLAHRSGVVVLALPATQKPSARSCARSYHKVRQFCVQGLDGFSTEYILYLRRPGQKKLATMYVGLGGSGEVAREIIDSIRPAPRH